tara:strand:+ start:824 stop:1231 length:408 start_codon:yes stop_codon:yes gene_type:complete
MALKVIKYKNYGCTMTSEDDNHKFYFSFYELNNGEIIELMLFQSDDEDSTAQCDLYYTKFKLKSGEIIDYNFGNAKANNENEMSKEFFDWFDSCPPAKVVINNTIPNKNEEKCVKDFYIKNIEPFKLIQTDTTEV